MKRLPPQLDLSGLGRLLSALGLSGRVEDAGPAVRELLVATRLCVASPDPQCPSALVATSHLFDLGPTRDETSALRRVLALAGGYRVHLLQQAMHSLRHLPDDRALADTLEQLDHLSPELLTMLPDKQGSVSPEPGRSAWAEWDVKVWQSPDPVTLLAKVVENPHDFPMMPTGAAVGTGFGWLSWTTPPVPPAPAPWGDARPLQDALDTVRHPFWGALVATLDACTGDYPWQSLMLRGNVLRSRHRALGPAEVVLRNLWATDLGLFPAAPLVVPATVPFSPGQALPWLQPSLEQLAVAGVATLMEGSWRLTDAFRTKLMEDDEHMTAFEMVRQRSFRLARAADNTVGQAREAVTT